MISTKSDWPQTRQKKILQSILLVFMLLIGASNQPCDADTNSAEAIKGNPKMNMNIEEWKPWCFGRFVVMLPPDTEVGVGNPRYNFRDISTTPMEPEAFQAMLQERLKQLKAIKHDKVPSYLLDARVIENVPMSGIFIHYTNDAGTATITLEAYRLINGLSYKLVSSASPDRMDIARKIMSDLVSRLEYRGDQDIPTRQGFCFRYGFIPDDGKIHDNFTMNVNFPGHPDATLDFEMYTNGDDNLNEPLLDNANNAIASLGNMLSGLHTIRKGNRKLGDNPGQELLVKGPQEGGYIGHFFRWEAIGLPEDPSHPQIGIEFSTANRFQAFEGQPASFSDDEALKLWDQILSTFKLRPVTEPQKTSQIPAPRFNVKIGTKLVNTKQPCPQTGYWISAVDGERLLLRAGEAMPPAKVYKPQTRLEKLTGKTPDFEYMETVWTLAAYADNGGKIIEGNS